MENLYKQYSCYLKILDEKAQQNNGTELIFKFIMQDNPSEIEKNLNIMSKGLIRYLGN